MTLGAGSGGCALKPPWGWIWKIHFRRNSPCFVPGSGRWRVLRAMCLWAQGTTFCLRKAGRAPGVGGEETPSSSGSLRPPGCPMPGGWSFQDEPGKWPRLSGLEIQLCLLSSTADLERGSLSFLPHEKDHVNAAFGCEGKEVGPGGKYLRVVVFPSGSCHILTRVARVLAMVASWELTCTCQVLSGLLCQRWLVVQLSMKPGPENGGRWYQGSHSPTQTYILVVLLDMRSLR